MFRYLSVIIHGVVCMVKLHTIERNQLIHVGVINEKIKTLKHCKIQQDDTLLNLLITFS
jgi:hypothetical protein